MRSGLQDALVPLVEAFGASRLEQRRLRKAMAAAPACERPLRDEAEADVACWRQAQPLEAQCPACQQHEAAWRQLQAERKENKARLRKIERIAIKAAQAEAPPPPEPMALLELMEEAPACDTTT